MRRNWHRFSAALVFCVLVEMVGLWAMLQGTQGQGYVVLSAEVMRLLFYALLATAVGGLVGAPRVGERRAQHWADLGFMVAAGAVFLFYAGPVTDSELLRRFQTDLPVFFLQLMGCLALMLGCAALLIAKRSLKEGRVVALAAALAAELAAATMALYSPDSDIAVSWGPLRGFHLVAVICLALAVMTGSPSHRVPIQRVQGPRGPFHFSPYVAFASVLAFVVARFWEDYADDSAQLVFCLAALGAGIVLREVLWRRDVAVGPVKEVIKEGEDRLRSLLSNSSDLILVLDPDGSVRYVSPSVKRVLGFDLAAVWSPSLLEFVHEGDWPQMRRLLQKATDDVSGASFRGEWRLRNNAGEWLHVEGIVSNHLGDAGISGLLLNVRDVTERKVLEGRLVHQALHDSLTGLANRALLLDRAAQALAQARRRDEQIGILFLDLDDFKHVNDTFGHPEGDRLLREIAARILATCRSADTVARLGGDEFAVLVEESATLETICGVADRILEQLRFPVTMARGQFIPTTSIGIALTGGDVKPEELLRRADVAMYAAKAQGKNGLVVFEADMDEPLKHRLRLEADLREAVAGWRLTVYYQPVVALATTDIVGAEALIRWQHPELGLLLPRDFLDVAGEAGLMSAIGGRVLLDACSEVAGWQRRKPGGDGLQVSVNLSTHQLSDPQLPASVADALSKSRLPPHLLILEITENSLIGDQGVVLSTLGELAALGVKVAIDDFGTHYSSLSYLKNLPVHLIKLDRSFVADLLVDDKCYQIVRAVTELARTLGIDVIAEGIEREEQRARLAQLGCGFGQGFLFHKPGPAYEVRELLPTPERPNPPSREERGAIGNNRGCGDAIGLVAQLDPTLLDTP